MDEREIVRSLDWSQRSVTRRLAFGVFAGGIVAVARNEIGLARKKRRGRKKSSRVGEEAKGGVTQRPITDFLSAQGTTTEFVPPVRDVIGWAEPPAPNSVILPFAWVDYAGVADEYLGGTLGTTLSGHVLEWPQADGRAKVQVNLHATNALAWMIKIDLTGDVLAQIANAPTHFGYRPQDVNNTHPAALVDATLDVVFFNTAPGAPLPDLVTAINGGVSTPPSPPPGFALLSEKFRAHGDGSINDPAPGRGRLTVVQTAPRLDKCITADCFPAEIVRVQPVGH